MLMMTGKKLFSFHHDVLSFGIHPLLTKDFFDENHEVSFHLFESIKVTIKNPSMKDTFDLEPIRYELKNSVDTVVVEGQQVDGHLAELIRKKHFDTITITLQS
jgi:hypothetical protein